MAEAVYPRSPRILLGGLAHLARMIDKVRLRHAGGIPDYTYLTDGFDKAMLDFLQIDAASFEQRVLAGGTDDDILEWTRAQGRLLREAEIRLWTRGVFKAKPGDAVALQRYRDLISGIAAKRGVPIDTLPTVTTWVEGIDLDEGRL